MPKPTDYDKTHLRNMAAMGTRIDRIFKKATEEAARIGVSIKNVNPDRMFSFADYPETKKQVDRLMSALQETTETCIANGVRSSWTLANNKNNALCHRLFGDNVGKLTDEQYRKYFSTNGAALEAFLQRKTAGLNLSDRVWKYTNAFKNEIEMGLDCGIRSGKDAPAMARELKEFLQYPDKLFRRVRDERGLLQLSQAAADFHPGQGVYRSSYKNARRLAATETNIAYCTSDHLRWQQMDFVVGIQVMLSNNHTVLLQPGETTDDPSQLRADGTPKANAVRPLHDICDELAGRYPKDFVFLPWHPHCRCHAVPILKTADEMAEDTQRILDGKEPTQESENTVEDVPQAFKDHVEKYAVKIQTVNKTRLPYYIQNNLKYVDATTSLLKSITVGDDTYVIKDLLNECKRIETENGTVYVHPNHGKPEYQENLQMAKWRANDFGEQVILLPNPNNGTSADFYNITRKTLEESKINTKGTINSIDRSIRDGSRQADHLIIELRSDMKVGDFTDAITNRVKRCERLKELRVKIGDCEAVYTREEIIRDGFKIKPEDFHIGQSLRSQGVQLSPNTATKLDNFFGTSKKTPKEIAEIRHSARTADEIKGIQQAWNKSRVESLKTALNDGLLPKGCTAKLEELLKLNTSGNFAAFQKEIKPLQKAVARHTARTQKQAEELKARWDKRVFDNAKTRRDANRVLTLAKSYSEVDYAQLEALVAGNDLAAMETETKKVLQALKDMRAEERALQDLIPDVHEWHKKFTLEELKEAHKKVVDTMAYYKTKFDADLAAGTNLEKLKDQLLDKIKYVENPGAIHPGAIPAKTWQAQQNAYIKMLAKTEQKIKLEALNAEYKVLLSFKTTSKSYNEYLPKIKAALDSGDEKKAEWLMGGAKTRKIMLERARKGKTSMRSVAANFDAADYTEKAKKNAIWCKTAKESHKNWDADSEAAWKGATSGERKGWRDYTGGSGHMNRPLRGYDKNLNPNASAWSKKNFVGVGNVDLDIEGGEANIRNLYNLLERCTFDTNRWLQRGLETWDGFEGFLGFSKPGQSVTREQVRAMVGKEVTDYAFMSCGSAKGTGFSGVILNIYCPKGTKGVYACPHSCFGDGENETILQLGTKFRITKVECPDRGNVYIDLEVIGYEKHPSL